MRRFPAVLALALIPAALLPAVSCSRSAAPRPRNVLFILVDTLRADHLGVYGHARPTSPALDAFARESVLFADVRSQASCTFPSVNSILTSRSPAAFLGQPEQRIGIPDQIPSLAEILRLRGFRTAAVSASSVVRRSPSRFNLHGGFDRGFDAFLEDCVWQPAACVNRQALELLRVDDGRPFFLYLHYIDPHGPYAPPAGYQRRFATGSQRKWFIRRGDPNPIGEWLYKGKRDPQVTPAELQFLVDLYDDEIAYLDSQLEILLGELRKSGRLDDTLIVFAADHGEEFLEHHHIKHCRDVFDVEVRVPLVLRIPGVEPRTVSHPVQNLDLVPTILDYLGLPVQDQHFEGVSLRAAIDKKSKEDGFQHSLAGSYRSVADGRYKLIHDLAAGTFALYDLRADPGETRDVLPQERRAFHRLQAALTAWLAKTEGAAAAGESVRRAEEEIKKLRALGYLE